MITSFDLLITIFRSEKRVKQWGTTSTEKGGCGTTAITFLARNSHKDKAE